MTQMPISVAMRNASPIRKDTEQLGRGGFRVIETRNPRVEPFGIIKILRIYPPENSLQCHVISFDRNGSTFTASSWYWLAIVTSISGPIFSFNDPSMKSCTTPTITQPGLWRSPQRNRCPTICSVDRKPSCLTEFSFKTTSFRVLLE